MLNKIDPIQGITYRIINRNDDVVNGTIISKRNGSKPGSVDYLVHYENTDRRLDQWIPVERILEEAVCENSNSNSYERNRRRTRAKNEQEKESIDKNENLNDNSEINEEYAQLEKDFLERTKIKYIEFIRFGQYELECWYFSPFPVPFRSENKLYICERCLSYMKYSQSYCRHIYYCKMEHPPGTLIYNKDDISAYQVDDHKTVYYDVTLFEFFLVCVKDEDGIHLVGYFSKDKESAEEHNLACLLVLPQYQGKGFGKFIVSLSYEISIRNGTLGTPERPLSDLGERTYDSYWKWKILKVVADQPIGEALPIDKICQVTGFTSCDVRLVLEKMNMLTYFQGQYKAFTDSKNVAMQMRLTTEPKLLVDANYLSYNSNQKCSSLDQQKQIP